MRRGGHHSVAQQAGQGSVSKYSFIEKLTNRNLNTEMEKLVIHKQYKNKTKENTISNCQQTTF